MKYRTVLEPRYPHSVVSTSANTRAVLAEVPPTLLPQPPPLLPPLPPLLPPPPPPTAGRCWFCRWYCCHPVPPAMVMPAFLPSLPTQLTRQRWVPAADRSGRPRSSCCGNRSTTRSDCGGGADADAAVAAVAAVAATCVQGTIKPNTGESSRPNLCLCYAQQRTASSLMN